MTTTPDIHRITLGDLRSGATCDQWNDPHAIAQMNSPKHDVFLTNPFTQDDETVVQLLAVRDGTVVGREDMLPGALLVEGERIHTSWGSGMFVPEAYRGQGIGKLLATERERVHETVCSCGVSQMLYPIYKKHGWTDFPMRRYILPLTARPIVEMKLGAGAVSKAATAIGNVGLALHSVAVRAITRSRTGQLHVERVDRADDALDALLEQSNSAYAVTSPRSSAWVNWLLSHAFTPHPRNDSGLLIVRDATSAPASQGGGTALAYALYKIRFHETASHRGFRNVLLGSLQDWLVFAPDKLTEQQLILAAVREMMSRGVDAIEICLPATTPPRFLRTLGFIPLGEQYLMFKAPPNGPLRDSKYHAPESWRIRPVEGDSFFV
jgi:GNAT superfamily N-acetyltransferase